MANTGQLMHIFSLLSVGLNSYLWKTLVWRFVFWWSLVGQLGACQLLFLVLERQAWGNCQNGYTVQEIDHIFDIWLNSIKQQMLNQGQDGNQLVLGGLLLCWADNEKHQATNLGSAIFVIQILSLSPSKSALFLFLFDVYKNDFRTEELSESLTIPYPWISSGT